MASRMKLSRQITRIFFLAAGKLMTFCPAYWK
jgi:hypothetical protein